MVLTFGCCIDFIKFNEISVTRTCQRKFAYQKESSHGIYPLAFFFSPSTKGRQMQRSDSGWSSFGCVTGKGILALQAAEIWKNPPSSIVFVLCWFTQQTSWNIVVCKARYINNFTVSMAVESLIHSKVTKEIVL